MREGTPVGVSCCWRPTSIATGNWILLRSDRDLLIDEFPGSRNAEGRPNRPEATMPSRFDPELQAISSLDHLREAIRSALPSTH